MLGELWWDEGAVTTAEYALLLVLIAVGTIAAYQAFGNTNARSVDHSVAQWPAESPDPNAPQ